MLLCVATTPGCLLGPPVEGLPEEELHPPKIIRDQLRPPMEGITYVIQPDGCSAMDFEVFQISDKNVGDDLQLRWFLDWKGAESEENPISSGVVPPSGSEIRSGDILQTYRLSLDSPPRVLDPSLPHTITVVVADRALRNDVAALFPEETEEGQEGQLDVYQWTFFLTDAGYCSELK